jgi:hypothetical protein
MRRDGTPTPRDLALVRQALGELEDQLKTAATVEAYAQVLEEADRRAEALRPFIDFILSYRMVCELAERRIQALAEEVAR